MLDLIDLENKISIGEPIVTKVEAKVKKIGNFTFLIDQLKKTRLEIKTFLNSDITCNLASSGYNEAKTDYIELLTKIGKCPLCWNKIDQQCIEAIIKAIEEEL